MSCWTFHRILGWTCLFKHVFKAINTLGGSTYDNCQYLHIHQHSAFMFILTGVPGSPLSPGNPLSPGGPSLPGPPGGPGSPLVPSFPEGPGSPCSPGGPGGPGWPRSPMGPVSPDGPWKVLGLGNVNTVSTVLDHLIFKL